MARPLKIKITETLEELKKRLSKSNINREKLIMLYELKKGVVTTRKELAEKLSRDNATITRWLNKYREGGIEELLLQKKAPGKTPKITAPVWEKLSEKLQETEGFSSYGEIQKWLESECGVKVAYHTVYKKVRYQLQAKLKRPRPSHLKKDLAAQDLFKKNSQAL